VRVLLDESVPRPLAAHLPNHDVQTVPRLQGIALGLVVVEARDNRTETFVALAPRIDHAIQNVKPGQVVRVIETPDEELR